MSRHSTRWLAFAALAGTVAAVSGWLAARQHRKRLVLEGRLRQLRPLWIQVNGLRIYARASTKAARPDTPPVVLVHGWGVSSSYFVPCAERLATDFAVYAPDLPGHGRSEKPDKPLDISGLAQSLLDWMDSAGISRAALVGQSMGCQIVVEAALRRPERVGRLVLIAPTLDPTALDKMNLIGRFLLAVPFERPTLVPIVLKDYLRMNLRVIPEYRFMKADRIEEKLRRIHVPTLVMRGEHDSIVPPDWLAQVARLVDAQCSVTIRGRGHAVQHSAPDQTVKAIQPFLAGPVPRCPVSGGPALVPDLP